MGEFDVGSLGEPESRDAVTVPRTVKLAARWSGAVATEKRQNASTERVNCPKSSKVQIEHAESTGSPPAFWADGSRVR